MLMDPDSRLEGKLNGILSENVTEVFRNADDVSFYRCRANDFIDLHKQVESSISVLDTLESFLSTFQQDLSDVSSQISDLQGKSKEIGSRLKARRKIDHPLANLILDISISPDLAERILDSDVGEQWLLDIPQLEKHLKSLKSRPRLKAARALGEVGEGLRIVAAAKIRTFFLTLFQPIRSSISTNMQVLQTSVLLKYRPLFSFLKHYASDVATEVQHAYVVAARTYYETGFRRYVRALTWIKSRTTEKLQLIGALEKSQEQSIEVCRLANADIEGQNVVLAYMVDDKSHKEPVESLFRSLILVLMDNGTSEYAFITQFFDTNSAVSSLSPIARSPEFNIPSGVSEFTFLGGSRAGSIVVESSLPFVTPVREHITKGLQLLLDGIWKQVMNPVLEYCDVFSRGILHPSPPTISLLTMIRLLENVLGEVQKRDCPPLETFIMGLRLTFWPVFQKDLNLHIESIKKLADTASNDGFFYSNPPMRDTTMQVIVQRYAIYFTSFVTLTDNEEETMIFSNLLRLRNELIRLVASESSKAKDPAQRAVYQSTVYEVLLQALSSGPRPATHPKTQSEIAFWCEREVEAQRQITSARRKQ